MNERPPRRSAEWNPMPIEDVARGGVVRIECSSYDPDLIEPIPVRFDQIEDGPALQVPPPGLRRFAMPHRRRAKASLESAASTRSSFDLSSG